MKEDTERRVVVHHQPKHTKTDERPAFHSSIATPVSHLLSTVLCIIIKKKTTLSLARDSEFRKSDLVLVFLSRVHVVYPCQPRTTPIIDPPSTFVLPGLGLVVRLFVSYTNLTYQYIMDLQVLDLDLVSIRSENIPFLNFLNDSSRMLLKVFTWSQNGSLIACIRNSNQKSRDP